MPWSSDERPRPSYDVIVVGGRVAGASTAMLLARAGARVLLLERGRYGTDTLSTHGLMRAGVLQLSRWGLLDRLAAAGTPPVRSTTFRIAGDDRCESPSPTGRASTRCTPRAGTCSTGCWSTPPPRPARRCGTASG